MGKAGSIQASTKKRWQPKLEPSWRSSLSVVPLVFWLLSGLCYSRTRETAAPSFTIDVDQPFSQVVTVVEDNARSSVIKGTFEYAGDDQLTGAQFEESSRLFPTWSGAGRVFYKVRNKTLAPKHFINSNDVGTVAVRYVVQDNGARSTRLVIDALFVENGGHHGHPSDGYVETCEFAEIGKRLKELDLEQTMRASGHSYSPSRESSSQPDQARDRADAGATGDLGRALSDQKSRLAADTANLEQLELQVRQMRASEFVRIRAERAELKASPYAHARVVEALKQGQEVTVLARSTYWYRVRSEDGQEGWLLHAAVETQP
jgi:hypothetical protein